MERTPTTFMFQGCFGIEFPPCLIACWLSHRLLSELQPLHRYHCVSVEHACAIASVGAHQDVRTPVHTIFASLLKYIIKAIHYKRADELRRVHSQTVCMFHEIVAEGRM